MYALETKNLSKSFGGVHAVDRLSLKFEKGKITGIVGPNGSGKTTLVNTLSGLLPIDSGIVIISGATFHRVESSVIAFYGLTRTFQEVRLFNQMTVLDNILVVLTERAVAGALFEKHTAHHLKQAQEVLQIVGLWEKRSQLAINLSYGQRKLLEIARALATQASVLLFDEPFAGLFPEMVKLVSSIMLDLKKQGKTLVLIEHNMNLIRELCDYLYVMDSGQLLAEGEPKKVLEQKNVIEAYLGE